MKWIIVACAAALALLLLPLCIGVWLPDVFVATPRTLAAATLPDGQAFRVIQYWNHCDFYNTELIHTSPDGTTETNVLDGDDSKSWSVPLVVDQDSMTVTVTLGGNRQRTVTWGKQMPNQAPEATSEPAPGAASSAPQG